jgi:transposase
VGNRANKKRKTSKSAKKREAKPTKEREAQPESGDQLRTTTGWSDEARRDAVAMMERGDVTVEKLAEHLGVSTRSLYRWKQEFEERDGSTPLSIEEKRELARLRKEVEVLRMEREILKKAATFFANRRS